MSQRYPWVVRHLYSTVDREFVPYLERLTNLLSQGEQAGWISMRHDRPVSDAPQITAAVSGMELGELLIVDLHGWAGDGTPPCLGPAVSLPFADLSGLPAGSWGAAAIVLSNCRGMRDQFLQELSRIVRGRTAVAGHFDGARTQDATPVELVRAVLRDADGGDADEAFNVLDRAIYDRPQGRRSELWGAELVLPQRRACPQDRGSRSD